MLAEGNCFLTPLAKARAAVVSWRGKEVLFVKLSIIIPVYNTREYLPACLDSVLDPALSDYEIIVVNDGSTDDSGLIAAAYAARHPNLIRVVATENGGLGAARNAGLYLACGDYLLFLDSDDALEKGALSEMLSVLDGSFDLGLFDLNQVNPSGDSIGIMRGSEKQGAFTLAEYPELLFQPPSGCNKLFRRSLFLESSVRFPGRVWYEDLRTVPKLYPMCGRIQYFPKAWYRYLIRPGSITNNANTARNLEIIDAAEEIIGYYKAAGLYEKYEPQLCYMAYYNVFLTASVRVCLADPDSDVLEKLMQWFLSHFPQWRENPYLRDMSPKYRLLTGLLTRRMRRSVKLIMGVNDRAKNKRG